ncbi:MAG TPA: transcription termination/antitermination factor NusG [Candidatus Onthoplasma faecigallinarum]|nr:transcription termination/antitermination factor NusG [Candidatus Onthoplasma faecigallinarum]
MAIIDNNKDKEPKWYALTVFSGYENIAKQNLENTIEKYGLQNRIFQIVIPMEDVLEEKRGKKVLVPKKTMPGYIMVKMIYGDDIWHAVIRTEYIHSFVGPKGRPVSITDEEARRLGLDGASVQDAKIELDVKVGDTVEIIEGSLSSFVGVVKAVDEKNQKVTVAVEMFGRESEVELGFNQIRVKQ